MTFPPVSLSFVWCLFPRNCLQTASVTQWQLQSVKWFDVTRKTSSITKVNMFIIISMIELFDHLVLTETSCKHTDVLSHYTVFMVSSDKCKWHLSCNNAGVKFYLSAAFVFSNWTQQRRHKSAPVCHFIRHAETKEAWRYTSRCCDLTSHNHHQWVADPIRLSLTERAAVFPHCQ